MNLFGLNINVNLRDRASSGVRALGNALGNVRENANRAVNSMRGLNQEVEDTAQAFELTADETEALSRIMNGASSYANSLDRQMQRLAHTLGQEVPESTCEAYATMFMFRDEMRKAKRAFGAYSPEVMNARNRLNEYILSMDDATFKQIYMRGQLGLTDMQLQQQANGMKLNARMTKLMGNQLDILVERMKGLQRFGVKPEMLIPPSTPGAFEILNRAVDSSSSKIYRLSALHRTLGNRVEKVIKNYSAMKVAVRQANGDMVRHALLMQQANTGMMNLGILAPMLAMGLSVYYGGLVKLAYNSNEGLQTLTGTVKGKVLKAMQPLLELVGDIAEAVLKMVGAIADWITKFNEAHPVLAKILSAVTLLLPALTLLMLPIGMLPFGIQSLMVALNGLWTLIAPFVAGLVNASGIALAFAGAIAVLTVGITHLWKTNEEFRTAVVNIWNNIKKVGTDVFNSLKETINGFVNAFKEGGIMGVLDHFDTVFRGMVSNITNNLPQLVESGVQAVSKFLEGIASHLPSVYEKGSEIIEKLVGSIINNINPIINSALTIFQAWLNAFTTNIGLFLNLGMHIITTLVNGIVQALPNIIDCGVQILQTLVQILLDNMPMIVDAAIMIIDGLIRGITEAIPNIVDAIVLLMEYIVTFLSENLPIIIQGALYIIEALAEGLIQALPLLLDSALQIMIAIVNGLVENLPLIGESALRIIMTLVEGILVHLPTILMTGVQIITSLVSGILQMIGQVLASATKIIGSFINTILSHLPQILSLGVQLIGQFVGGIFSAIGKVVDVAQQVIEKAKGKFREGIESFVSIGKDIISGLARGITNSISVVTNAISGVVTKVIGTGRKLLGINSPSRVFKQIGAWTSEGMAIGIEKQAPLVENSVEDMTRDAVNVANEVTQNKTLMVDVARNMTPQLPQASNVANNHNTNNFSYNITVNASATDNPQSMAQQIYQEIKRLQQLDMSMGYINNLDVVF